MLTTCREWKLFRPSVYRGSSPEELGEMPLWKLVAHFLKHGKRERRIFAVVAAAHERLSMRWLRGKGIEIGAGSSPLRLFGETSVVYADVDPTLAFGGSHADAFFTLDDTRLLEKLACGYDFAVASHVLEHVDSFIWGLKNLIEMTKIGGHVFVALPCIEHLHDKHWMPKFDFAHHLAEYSNPEAHCIMHDNLIIQEHLRVHNEEGYNVPKSERFLYHKHNYSYHDWLSLILQSLDFLGFPAQIVDSAYGYERRDFVVVFERA
jgi:hypothetical protein